MWDTVNKIVNHWALKEDIISLRKSNYNFFRAPYAGVIDKQIWPSYSSAKDKRFSEETLLYHPFGACIVIFSTCNITSVLVHFEDASYKTASRFSLGKSLAVKVSRETSRLGL